MSRDEYIHTVNPCYGCDCDDPDLGCTMSSVDILYACTRFTEEFYDKAFYYQNENFKAYVDKYCQKHKVDVETALSHKVVKEVKKQYETE